MQDSRYLQELPAASHVIEITEKHFGANSVGTANFALDTGPFDAAGDALGITHIRYPGGTLTEEKIDPDSEIWTQLITSDSDYITLPDGQRIQTLKSVLEYAGEHGLTVTLVLPTKFLLSDGEPGSRLPDIEKIDRMIESLGDALREIPDASRIAQIEIGNEYYYRGRMTADEYGMLVNEIAPKLQAELESVEDNPGNLYGFEVPEIAVQSGAGWRETDNETILSHLDSAAKAAIDAVVLHYYPRTLDRVSTFGRHFSEFDDWRDDPDFGTLTFHVSEWNIQNTDNSDNGMLHAGSLVAAFEELILQGVEMASIWGTQYRAMDTRLSTLSSRDTGDERAERIDTDLTPAGEVFSIMRSTLIGLSPLDLDTSEFILGMASENESNAAAQLLVTDFGNSDRYVAFVSNRDPEQDIDLSIELSDYFGQDAYVSIKLMSATDDPSTPNVDESDPTSSSAEPDIDFLFTGSVGEAPTALTLPEGAMIIVEVWTNPEGVRLEAQEPVSDEEFIDYADTLRGSAGNDTLLAHSGEDEVSGGNGNDLLLSGSGNDFAWGGSGDDALIGENGSDQLYGEVGSDLLSGGHGQDSLHGGRGSDILTGGEGDDFLFGGQGNDVLLSSAGSNMLAGGEGADFFVIGNAEHTEISDFRIADGDKIDVSDHFESGETFETALRDALAVSEGQTSIDLQLSDGKTLSISYSGESIDELIGSFHYSDSDNSLARMAAVFNEKSISQISAFIGSLDSGSLDCLISEETVTSLLEKLSPEASAGVILGLNPEEIAGIVSTVGPDSLFDKLQGLNEASLREVIASASRSQLEALLEQVPAPEMTAWFQGLSELVQQEIFDAFSGSELPKPVLPDLEEDDEPVENLPPELEEDDPSPIPDLLTPDEDIEDPDDENESPRPETGGDCYIATVAFGGMDHPVVWTLRWYRDTILRHSQLGRLLVAIYWAVGPRMARSLADEPFSKAIARALLCIIAWFISRWFKRPLGRQLDHVPWPENRHLNFDVKPAVKRRRFWPWKR